jgi:hypothetical protein
VPPADKVLSPTILAALGLAACEVLGPCLLVLTSKTDSDTSDTDTGEPPDTTETDADSDSDTDTDTDTDADADADTAGGSGTYGPCLLPTLGTGETGDTGTGGSGAVAPPPPSRAALFQRIEAEQVLPADVLERLKKRGS